MLARKTDLLMTKVDEEMLKEISNLTVVITIPTLQKIKNAMKIKKK